MANTCILIGSQTVGAGGTAGSITFSTIPQTYTDLLLLISFKYTSGSRNGLWIYPNGATTNLTQIQIYNFDGTSLGSNSNSYPQLQANGSAYSNSSVYFSNYASSNPKSMSIDNAGEINGNSDYAGFLQSALWNSSSAISSITLTPAGGTIAQYSTFYLYGIKNN